MDKFIGIMITGTNAGLWYLGELFRKAREKYGADYVPPVKAITIPFEPVNALLPNRMDEAAEKMLPYFRDMERMGIDRYILANITLHEAFDKVKGQISNPHLLHLHKIIAQEFTGNKQKIMLVGSKYTMSSTYLTSLFNDESVEIVRASNVLIQQLDMLRKTFYHRQDHEQAAEVFHKLLLAHPEVDAFVIACTEHALAIENLADKSRFISLPHLQIEYLLNKKRDHD